MCAHSSIGGLVHLEQFGMKQQSVGSLCVVVTLFVEVAQFVQVPGRKTVIKLLQDVYSVKCDIIFYAETQLDKEINEMETHNLLSVLVQKSCAKMSINSS